MKDRFSKVRVGVIFLLFALCFVVFLGRLVWVQLVMGEKFREKARRQYLQTIDVQSARGEIFDSRGNKVATNSSFQSLFAYPISKEEVDDAYRQLASILKRGKDEIRKKYQLTPRRFRWIKRGLSESEMTRFNKLKEPGGLYLKEEPTRSYPYGLTGSGILGFVDLDNCGKAGIELVMDNLLTGHDGRSLIQKDGKGSEFPIREIPLEEAVSGQSVVLTIDWNKQQIVEEELQRAVEKYNAKGGMAVFLDPHSGAVIAAADYRPDKDGSSRPVRLCAVCDLFEPGSVMKLVTAAAALESKSLVPSDTFYAEMGLWDLGRHRLRDDHKHGWLTFQEGFEVSSNILMGKVANQIGGDKVLAMARRFGFGRKTRCGLNGESKGFVDPPYRWSQFTTSTFAIGHGMSVTALQLAQAFGIIASGGYLFQPHFIKGCINDKGEVVNRHQPRPLEILDSKVVSTLDKFLRGVVESGTGQPIADSPFPIAGKTGTAEKPNLESGGYHKNRFMASFAGYFPADSPLVAGVVILDEPEPIHYGGYTAGPAFKNIAIKFGAIDNYRSSTLADYRQQPQQLSEHAGRDFVAVIVPDVDDMSRDEAAYRLKKLDLMPEFTGCGVKVLATFPAALAQVGRGEKVRCILDRGAKEKFEIPNLLGLTVREAVSVLSQYGLEYSCRGLGRVNQQTPAPGTVVTENEVVGLVLARNIGETPSFSKR